VSQRRLRTQLGRCRLPAIGYRQNQRSRQPKAERRKPRAIHL